MYNNIILPHVCCMDCGESKVEKRLIKQMTREEANGINCYHWKENKVAYFYACLGGLVDRT